MDDLVEYNRGDGAKIIFDKRTYFEIALSCLEKFANKSRIDAEQILKEGFFHDDTFPPRSYNEVALLDNELIYDVSMMSLYGDRYWENTNYKPIPMDEYYDWEDAIISEKQLNSNYFEYIE